MEVYSRHSYQKKATYEYVSFQERTAVEIPQYESQLLCPINITKRFEFK